MGDSVTFDLFARDRASGTFTKVGSAAAMAGREVDGLSRKTQGLGGHFTAVSRVGPRAFGVIATGAKAAGLGMAAAAVAGATMGIKTAASLEQAQVAFATLLHSGTKAQTFLSGLSKFAAATPFELPGLIDSSRILLGVGLNAKKVIPFLQDFGDTAGAVGIQQDGFNRIILAMSQSLSAGKIKLGDMNQLMDNGLPIWKLLSEALGKPVSKIQDLISHGKLLTADVLPKLQAQMHKDYGGAMAKQSQTLSGLWSTFMDTLNIGLAQSITPLIPALKTGLSGAIGAVGGVLGLIPKVAGPVITVLKKVGDAVGIVAGAFRDPDITSNGFAGVLEHIGVIGRQAVDFIRGTIVPGFQALGSAFSGEGVTSDGFVGVMENIGVIGKKTVDYITNTLVPNIITAFGSIKTKIGAALSGIDLSGIATSFTTQATKWGGALITGVKTGLATGDWSGLGQTVGKGIVAAIQGAGSFVKDIGSKIGDLLSKVDWVGIGISVGKQVPSLLIGLAAGILNFDLMGLLGGLAQHWQDVLFAIIAVAFTPAKILGKVGEILARIPLVGKLLAWGLEHFGAFSKRLVGMVGDALGFMGRAFLDGFRRVFPNIGSRFSTELAILPVRLRGIALDVADKARAMMRGLGNAIASGIGSVIAKIGELIGRMLKPFVNAAGWLVRRGIEFVGGLVRGVLSGLGSAGAAAGRVGSTILGKFAGAAGWLIRHGIEFVGGLARGIAGGIGSALGAVGRVTSSIVGRFAGAGGWLVSHGGDLLRGLLRGALNAAGAIGGWIKDLGGRIVGAVKGFFGIHSPSTVFAGLGGHLIDGLIKGMLQRNPAALVGKVFGGMTGAIRTLFSKNMLGNITNLGGKALSALGGLAGNIFGGGGGGGAPASVSGNAAIVKGTAASFFGWTGPEWDALYKLVNRESGFRNTAQNPTSTAFGLYQFLDSTWAGFGPKTSNPTLQSRYGDQYIKQRYGDPINAWGHEQVYGWYGGGMPPTDFYRPTLLGVGDRPETVTIVPHGRGGAGGDGASVVGEIRALRADVERLIGALPAGVGRQVGLTVAKHVGPGRR